MHRLAKKKDCISSSLLWPHTTNKPSGCIYKNMKLNIAVQKGINGLFTALTNNL